MNDKTEIQYGQYVVPQGYEMVNFGVGQPSNKLLPLNIVMKGLYENLEITNPALLQYGDIPGYLQFRESLAKYLEFKYNNPVSPKNLFVVNGVTGGLALICSLLTKTGATIYVEEPTYFLAINIFKEFNLTIVPIPIHQDGVDIDKLEDYLKEDNSNESKLFYTIPTFHNPTSYTMSEVKRQKLGELTNKYNLVVVSDEVYQLLYFDDQDKPPKPLCYYGENIISIGSFSKILAPSLRLGWIQTSPKYIKILSDSAQLDSSGGMNPLISSIVHKIIDNGDQDMHIQFIREELKNRCYRLSDEINKYLLDYVDYVKPTGGYFIWLKLKNKVDAVELLKLAENNKVKFHGGIRFSSCNELNNYLRLSFSYYSTEDLELGIKRLQETFKKYYDIRNSINVNILGFKGRLGSKIVEALKESEYSKKYRFNQGIDRNMEFLIDSQKNVIIDVSSSEGTKELLTILLQRKINVPLIIGTTGDLPINIIKEYSCYNPVALISNFSDGIPELIRFAQKLEYNKWRYSITETHHIHKKDMPSGTSLSIASCFPKDVPIQSFREGEVFGNHSLILENDYEHLEIKHIAKDRDAFAKGALKYIDWILEKKFGIYYSMYDDDKITFEKYSGCGNDFIIINNKNNRINKTNIKEIAEKLCKRGLSVGADGLILVENYNSTTYDFKWDYYNADGNMVEMCGNGARCVAKYAFENMMTKGPKIKFTNSYNIEIEAEIGLNNMVKIKMPEITNVDNNLIKTEDKFMYSLNIGVPHMVFIISDKLNIETFDVENLGKKYFEEYQKNINFMQFKNNMLYVRTYERGVNCETLACGSGCCACAYVYKLIRNSTPAPPMNKINVCVKSGDTMTVTFDNKDIYLEGKVEKIFCGIIK